jgi:3-dehydroquinate dehydratase-1
VFTVRTANEGGNLAVNSALYAKINRAAAETGLPDLVDVEVFSAGNPPKKSLTVFTPPAQK